jgi:acetyl esterase/lipase
MITHSRLSVLVFASVFSLLTLAVHGVSAAEEAGEPVKELNIWPEGTPGVDSSKTVERNPKRPTSLTLVHCPKLSVYPATHAATNPADKPTPAMIICPGGGYAGQAAQHEGHDVAKYFSQRGITCFVLQYRLPARNKSRFLHPVPVSDALRAIQYVRHNAKDFGIDPAKVGILGFSAGGHLTGSAATLYGKCVAGDDTISKVSARPDFAVLGYPVITSDPKFRHRCIGALLPQDASQEQLDAISCERNVTADTPPCFFFHAKDDKGVVPENSELMHEALKKAGVTTELKLYQKGGHGFGLGRKGADSTQWPGDLLVWLKHMKVL